MSRQADAREALRASVAKIVRWALHTPADTEVKVAAATDDILAALAASEPEREPGVAYQQLREQANEFNRKMGFVARTPEPAGDSEPTDLRELRERIEAWITEDAPGVVRPPFPLYLDDARITAAALERLEAFTELDARCLEIAADAELLHPTGTAEVREGNAATLREIAQKIRGALATPAPAPQGGEG